MLKSFEARHVRAVAVIALLGFLVLEWIPWMIQDAITASPIAPECIFWIQTFSGNWTAAQPPAAPVVGRWAYAFSAVVAVLTNNAMWLVVVGLLWRLLVEWRQRMKLKQLIAAHDQTTKQALFDKLPGEREAIQEAFKEGRRKLRKEVSVLFGPQEAERLDSIMNREV